MYTVLAVATLQHTSVALTADLYNVWDPQVIVVVVVVVVVVIQEPVISP